MKLTDAMVRHHVEAAAAALGHKTLGIVGYCFGGTVAWNMACRTKLFAAASGWYGGGIAATRTETPHCPVQLHFGELDHSIPLTDVELIRAAQPGIECMSTRARSMALAATSGRAMTPRPMRWRRAGRWNSSPRTSPATDAAGAPAQPASTRPATASRRCISAGSRNAGAVTMALSSARSQPAGQAARAAATRGMTARPACGRCRHCGSMTATTESPSHGRVRGASSRNP